MADRHVMICSSGRSGSKWLLDILDLSEWTFARNEPDEGASDAAFARIRPARELVGPAEAMLEPAWDDVVATASMSLGPRDQVRSRHKRYVRQWAKRVGADVLFRKHRLRRGLSALLPGLRGQEWLLPGWLVNRAWLAASVPIFKINNAPGWAVWALRNRPEARIVHLVRHPGGFLNSWARRYLAASDPDQVLRANRDRLRRMLEVDPAWRPLLGDVEAMTLEETELWYWRYANESLYVEGQGQPQYQVTSFERLAAEPVESGRQLYAFCGLEWHPQIERQVVQMSRQSRQIAAAWRSNLTREQVASVDRVLESSPLARLWQTEEHAGAPADGRPADHHVTRGRRGRSQAGVSPEADGD